MCAAREAPLLLVKGQHVPLRTGRIRNLLGHGDGTVYKVTKLFNEVVAVLSIVVQTVQVRDVLLADCYSFVVLDLSRGITFARTTDGWMAVAHVCATCRVSDDAVLGSFALWWAKLDWPRAAIMHGSRPWSHCTFSFLAGAWGALA